MAFESLAGKLEAAFKKLRGKGRLTEDDIKTAMREVKMALLEADVNFKIVKDFIKNVSERSVGADVLESLTPGQQVIKIVNEELIKLMGEKPVKLTFNSKPPSVYMLVGLQGAGKTTTCAKLAGAYAEATCAKIVLVSGKACGGAFIALAGRNAAADAVFALPEAVIAPVEPVTAAEFLYHDKLKGASDLAAERNKLAAEYAENEASAFAAAAKGAADDVVTAEEAREKIASVLDITAGKRLNKRLPKKHSILPL